MKRLAILIAFLALPFAALAAPMTNDDVIRMVKGGLGEATVIQAINAAEPAFDTSADGLIKLKQGGVSDTIIQRIISRPGSPASAAPVAATAAPAAAPTAAKAATPTCNECGTVTGVREVHKSGNASGVGAVAGGVVGGVLGRALGGKNHRTAGTVVGAAGGAVAGHMIEKKAKEGNVFEISVRFDDGATRTFTQETHPSWVAGSRVKLLNGALTPL